MVGGRGGVILAGRDLHEGGLAGLLPGHVVQQFQEASVGLYGETVLVERTRVQVDEGFLMGRPGRVSEGLGRGGSGGSGGDCCVGRGWEEDALVEVLVAAGSVLDWGFLIIFIRFVQTVRSADAVYLMRASDGFAGSFQNPIFELLPLLHHFAVFAPKVLASASPTRLGVFAGDAQGGGEIGELLLHHVFDSLDFGLHLLDGISYFVGVGVRVGVGEEAVGVGLGRVGMLGRVLFEVAGFAQELGG